MSSKEVVAITDGVAEAALVPELGAGLAFYDLLTAGPPQPLFRPCREPSHPFDLALNLLVPWSNRISGGGFTFEGEFHRLWPNLRNEPFPIHGNAFSSPWTIDSRESTSATLTLESMGPGPYRYAAWVTYRLRGGRLTVRLRVRNIGGKALPFGMGVHPWLPRTPQTRLKAKSERVVLENRDHLPAGDLDVRSREDWNFESSRQLPEAWINNAFLGWNRRARITWPDRGLSLGVYAGSLIRNYILYSPSADSNFFCFEPVTHPVDAHNLPGGPEANGLVTLRPGQEFSISCRFAPSWLRGLT